MPGTDSYEKALTRLREALENSSTDSELSDILSARDQVIARFQPMFTAAGIDRLTREQFKEFLLFKNNRHWTGLARLGSSITRDMDALKQALHGLVDESVPIDERIDRFYPDGKTLIRRLGKAVLTPILLIAYPDRYGVWNNTLKNAMKELGLWPDFKRGLSLGAKYARINAVLLKLAEDLDLDLWRLDALWWRIGTKGKPSESAWVVRAGEHGEQEEVALSQSVAVIGFLELPDLAGFDTKECLADSCKKLFPEYSSSQVGNLVGQMWDFSKRITESDLILLPLKSQRGMVAVGEATGEYAYQKLAENVGHTIPVEWLATVRSDKLPEDVLPSLGTPKTVSRVGAADAAKKIRDALETTEFRESEQVAREVIEEFYPDASARRSILRAFAESIREAHSFSEQGYSINLARHRDRIRLNIGGTQAFRLIKDVVNVVIDESELTDVERGKLDKLFDRTYNYTLTENAVDLMIPYEQFSDLYPLFRGAHEAFIRHPARRVRIAIHARAHSPGTLRYLRSELGEDVPEPVHPRTQRRRRAAPQEISGFNSQTFELLEELHRNPTRAFYSEHKDDFKTALIRPFKAVMNAVADTLPDDMKDALETERRVFAKIPKNDWGKGGAWDFYWAAFYPKGGSRIRDAQLAMWINHNILKIGFFLGQYSKGSLNRFANNVGANRERLAPILDASLGSNHFVFVHRDERVVEKLDESPCSLDDLFERPGEVNSVQHIIPREEVLGMGGEELVERVRDGFKRLYPLMALALADDPLSDLTGIEAVETEEDTEIEVNPVYALAECAEDTGFDLEELESWVGALKRKGQAVIYGPPGTGKTFLARHLAKHVIGGGDGFMRVVQFHPAYAYEDFMQGLRPKPGQSGGLEFELVAGKFLEFSRESRECKGPCVLIIDEINRANLSRVFGELMYLLEYRDEQVPLASGGTLRIPKNVRLIGTMNTADRSIAVVDHALRRRFAFIPLFPNYELLEHHLEDSAVDASALIKLLTRVNERIDDPNYSIGVSFFLIDDLESHIESIWKMEIEPYLEEFFFDQQKTVDEFRWRQVRRHLAPGATDE